MTLKAFSKLMRRPLSKWKQLKRDNSGLALVEFAFITPIILGLGLMGTETAYYVITHMQVSQVAMQVADNASRVGEFDVLEEKKVYEDDIIEVFIGAEKLGRNIRIFDNGRVILSSLQMNNRGGQWIAWQRCRGAKNHTSSFGVQGDGQNSTGFEGMGSGTNKIQASSGTAVMFVEVSYTYEALTPFDFLDQKEINYTAAFNIRDSRDLTKLYGSQSGQVAPTCNRFTA